MELGLRLPPAELIDRIVRETLYVPKLAGDEQGRQRLANLEKLRQFARTSARQGVVNLYDFVERLTVLVEREVNEGEEEIDSPEDAVRVMTVHAAKGLEFPIVILPRLHKRFQYDHEPYLDEQLGIGFSLPGEGEEEELAPIAAFLKEQNKQKTIEEEKRILYVACTRARDMLVLSGEWESGRRRVHAFNWILDGLGIDQEKPRGAIHRQVRLETLKTAGARMERRKGPHVLRIPVSYPADLPVEKILARQEAATSSSCPRLLVDPLEVGRAHEEFTGEMLRSYVECPHRYFARYVLGTPTDEQAEASATFDANVEALLRRDDRQALLSLVPSKQLGAILHQPEIHILLPVATSVPEGILSDTLPLVYQDSDGVWSFMRMNLGGGRPGTERFIWDSYRFLLEFDLLLLQRLKDAAVVRGMLVRALHPGDVMVVEADQRAVETYEAAVSKVLGRIHHKEYGHRTTPCPVCHVSGR
jgi:UvrD-like helicase C-terminal domain